jgi:predicted transposase/invertase (TIGR01784 family)
LKSVIDTAFDEGKLEGLIEGKLEGRFEGKVDVARSLKENGLSVDIIMKTTGLTKDEIERL